MNINLAPTIVLVSDTMTMTLSVGGISVCPLEIALLHSTQCTQGSLM